MLVASRCVNLVRCLIPSRCLLQPKSCCKYSKTQIQLFFKVCPTERCRAYFSQRSLSTLVSSTAGLRKKNVENNDEVYLQIQHDIQSHNKLLLEDVEAAIFLLVNHENQKEKGLLLLKCCGKMLANVAPKKRTELALQVWDILLKKSFVSVNHFEALLQCYLDNGHEVLVKDVLRSMLMVGIEPSERCLYLLLCCVSEKGNLGQMSAAISALKAQGYSSDQEALFAALLIGHSIAGDAASARHVLDTMKASGLKPGPAVLTSLLRSAALSGNLAAMHNYYTMAEEKQILLTSEQLLQVAESAALSNNFIVLPIIVKWISEREFNSLLVENAIIRWIHLRKILAAQMLLPLVSKHQDSESLNSVFFIEEIIHSDTSIDIIISVCKEMREQINTFAMERMVEIIFKKGHRIKELPLVYEAFKELGLPLRPHYMWPVILHLRDTRGETGVLEAIKIMVSKLKMELDEETLRDYVVPYLSTSEPDILLARLRDVSGLPLSQLLVPVLTQMVRKGQLKAAAALGNNYRDTLGKCENPAALDHALVLAFIMSVDVVSTVELLYMCHSSIHLGDWLFRLTSWRDKKLEPAKLLHLFQGLAEKRMKIPAMTAEIVKNKLDRMDVSSDAIKHALDKLSDSKLRENIPKQTRIPHPDSMTLKELECHFVELQSKGMNTRGVLRRLMQQYCRAGNITRAKQVGDEMLQLGVVLSPGMKSAFLEMHIRAGDIDSASKCLADIVQTSPTFRVDSHKILDLAMLFVKKGDMEGAIQLLQQHPNEKVTADNLRSIERNCFSLLSTAVDCRVPPTALGLLLQTMLDLMFCKPTNVLLGPLVRSYINSGDLDEATATFQRLSKAYRTTPLQHELMMVLINNQNWAGLEEVVSCAQAVHGVAATDVVLSVSYAKAAGLDSLDSHLQKRQPDLKTNKFSEACLRLSELGDVTTLNTLLEGALRHPNLVDSQPIISSIFKIFHQTGDSNSSLDFYNKLNKLKLPVPDSVKLSLASLLSSTRDTPFQ